jgi:hypothetical protein
MSASSNPQAKIDRARENLDVLDKRIRDFAHNTYTVDIQGQWLTEPTESWKSRKEGDWIIWAHASADPPEREWGAIIGDVVHGLRSALDQLAWGLSVAHQATLNVTPPSGLILQGDPWRSVWFPICKSPSAWDHGAVPTQLQFIDQGLLAVLKPLQPFMTGQNAPDREPLAMLQELWNIDKHRHLHLVNTTIELVELIPISPPSFSTPDFPDIEFEVTWKRPPGPLVGHQQIGRARMKPHLILKGMTSAQPFVYPYPAIDVAFDQGHPAYGGSLLHTLRDCANAVQANVDAV